MDAIRRKYLNAASHYSWFGDVDSAEMFHNYTLSEKAQPYAGVDFSLAEKIKALRWEQCTRMACGDIFPICNDKNVCVGDKVHNG